MPPKPPPRKPWPRGEALGLCGSNLRVVVHALRATGEIRTFLKCCDNPQSGCLFCPSFSIRLGVSKRRLARLRCGRM
jgi:hypothetical protein